MRITEIHFEEIGSTNSWAKENLTSFDREGITVVTAEMQRLGRGRFGKVWLSPPRMNVYATFVFFLDQHCEEPFAWTQKLAQVVVEVLGGFKLKAEIKWPNDILVAGKKIAGILCEVVPQTRGEAVLLGLGLNVNMTQEWVEKIDQSATSMRLELGKEQNRNQVLEEVKRRFIIAVDAR